MHTHPAATDPVTAGRSRRPQRAGRPGPISALVLAGTLVLAGLGVGSGTVGAQAPGGPSGDAAGNDPVAAALAAPDALTTLDQVHELGEQTAGDSGVPVGVVSDSNGAAPGGIEVTRVMADASQVTPLTEQLSQVDGVVGAAQDRRMRATADPYVGQQFGPVSIRASVLPTNADGLGMVVAVLDSGVDASHQDLSPTLRNGQPRVLTGTTFLAPAQQGDPDLTGLPGNVDPYGHGTHVAGIISAARGNGAGGAGVAPGAQILPIRVLDDAGEGWQSDITAGIYWAHQQGADIINLSLSGTGPEPRSMTNAINWVTSDASRGKPPTVVFAAAGNDGTGSAVQWPAAAANVIAVAATDSNHQVSWFSSRGSYVDLAAPGQEILSTCLGNTYCVRSGTSMATPLAAGAAAIIRQQWAEVRGPTQIRDVLQSRARDIASPGWDNASGYGEIDVAAAYDPTTWPPFPPIPAPVRLPWGYVSDLFADGRRVVVAGKVADLDGNPPVIVSSPAFGDHAIWPNPEGLWLAVYDAPPGTHDVCVKVLDNPTLQGVSLGCRDVVVK